MPDAFRVTRLGRPARHVATVETSGPSRVYSVVDRHGRPGTRYRIEAQAADGTVRSTVVVRAR